MKFHIYVLFLVTFFPHWLPHYYDLHLTFLFLGFLSRLSTFVCFVLGFPQEQCLTQCRLVWNFLYTETNFDALISLLLLLMCWGSNKHVSICPALVSVSCESFLLPIEWLILLLHWLPLLFCSCRLSEAQAIQCFHSSNQIPSCDLFLALQLTILESTTFICSSFPKGLLDE